MDDSAAMPTALHQLTTPALLVERSAFEANLNTMARAWPGLSLRPHVKAFKSTAVAARLAEAGHTGFCCATVREVEGMAAAGLGADLLLANEVLDAGRLGAVAAAGARVTVAVDSDITVEAAAAGGVKEVLIDVNVGLPRCGCDPADAGRLAELARSRGLQVRGVMGYEGHVMDWTDREKQKAEVDRSMAKLLAAHEVVGGEIISGGGTGTFDLNEAATELQAGSYLFMDTHYTKVGLPFEEALSVLASVISVGDGGKYAVADCGLKSFGMDHGDPSVEGGSVFFCSDEHTTLLPGDQSWQVGDRVRLTPAHVDPTIAKHPQMWLVDGDEVVEQWPVDLMHW